MAGGAATARNLRRLELALVVVVLALLVGFFARRMERVEAAMERTMLQLVVQDLQARLMMRAAGVNFGPEPLPLAELIGANPVQVLTAAPGEYLGERTGVDWSTVPPGAWVYDRSDGTLGYRVRHARFIDTGAGAPPARVRWRIEPVYVDLDGDGRFEAGRDRLVNVRLRPVTAYRWDLQ